MCVYLSLILLHLWVHVSTIIAKTLSSSSISMILIFTNKVVFRVILVLQVCNRDGTEFPSISPIHIIFFVSSLYKVYFICHTQMKQYW